MNEYIYIYKQIYHASCDNWLPHQQRWTSHSSSWCASASILSCPVSCPVSCSAASAALGCHDGWWICSNLQILKQFLDDFCNNISHSFESVPSGLQIQNCLVFVYISIYKTGCALSVYHVLVWLNHVISKEPKKASFISSPIQGTEINGLTLFRIITNHKYWGLVALS